MAFDNTQPRVKLVIAIGVVSVVIFLVTALAVQSYYLRLREEEYQAKVATIPPEQLAALRQKEAAKQPAIDAAVQKLAAGGRMVGGALLAPQPSKDTSALYGWGERVRAVPGDALSAEVPAAADGGR